MSSKPLSVVTPEENPAGRASNWLEATSRSLLAHIPETEGCCDYLALRLSALLIERVPAELGEDLLALLPEHEREHARPLRANVGEGNASIGYPDFVQRALYSLGCQKRFDPGRLDELSVRVVNVYLWAFASEVPLEIKDRLAGALPLELRSRMNLYTGHSESAKVA